MLDFIRAFVWVLHSVSTTWESRLTRTIKLFEAVAWFHLHSKFHSSTFNIRKFPNTHSWMFCPLFTSEGIVRIIGPTGMSTTQADSIEVEDARLRNNYTFKIRYINDIIFFNYNA